MVTRELGNFGTRELRNLGTSELGNFGTWELLYLGRRAAYRNRERLVDDHDLPSRRARRPDAHAELGERAPHVAGVIRSLWVRCDRCKNAVPHLLVARPRRREVHPVDEVVEERVLPRLAEQLEQPPAD